MSSAEPGETRWSPARTLQDVVHIPAEAADYFTTDFRFEPRGSEAGVLARIEDLVSQQAGQYFQEVDLILDALYESVRLFDYEGGEKIYRKYSDGRYVEDWSGLAKALAEQTLWDLQRVIIKLESLATDLEMRMKYAYTSWDEEYQEGYSQPVEGTVGDRTSHGRRKSREARSYYLFTYIVYRKVRDRVDTLRDTRRMLEFQVQRGTKQAFKY